MILSDLDIRQCLKNERLIIDPLYEPIQPTSVDLRLGTAIIRPKGGHLIDPLKKTGSTDVSRPFVVHNLKPGEFILGCTQEHIEIPRDLVGILMGKSSLARFGLQIESAGYVDPGWRGKLTLEIVNLGQDIIVLRPGMLICQIRFEPVITAVDRLYGDPSLNSHYQHAKGPQVGYLGMQGSSEFGCVALDH